MKRNRFGDVGFTMVEMLIVVAIIGILATLALTNFSLFKGQALNATAASDARGIAPAADIASGRDGGPPVIPPFGPTGGNVPDSLGTPLPGARTSPGTRGTIDFPAANQYVIKTHQVGGDCYTVRNGVISASPGVCP